jgi:chaperone BCS1
MHKHPLNTVIAPYALTTYKFQNNTEFTKIMRYYYILLDEYDINNELKKIGSNMKITKLSIIKIIDNYIDKNNIPHICDVSGNPIYYSGEYIYAIAVSKNGHIVYYLRSNVVLLTITGKMQDPLYIKEALYKYICDEIVSNSLIQTDDQIYVPTFVTNQGHNGNNTTIELKSIGPINKKKTFDTLFYPQKAELIRILTKFQNKTMYPSHIPMDNKLGIILYGPPGTGKTGTVSAIANMLKRNLLVINFTTITTCKQLDEILNTNNYSKYVYVFDEFDCIMDVISGSTPARDKKEEAEDWGKMLLYAEGEERKSILEMMKQNRTRKDTSPIDLAYLLQKLDGLESAEDRIIIATTNNPERLNPALLRPGRFDIKICLGLCTPSMVVDIITNFYKGDAKLSEKIRRANIPGNRFSPLQLVNMAIQASSIDKLLKQLSN